MIIKNPCKYVADRNKKELTADLKTIYHAPSEDQGHARILTITEKWQEHYPNAMKSWSSNRMLSALYLSFLQT